MAKARLLVILVLIMIVEINSFMKNNRFIIDKSVVQPISKNNMKLFDKLVKVTNAENSKTTEIPPGSPLSLACVQTDLRLSFQCKQGSCGSCEVMLDGKVVRSCITKVPDKEAITVQKKLKR